MGGASDRVYEVKKKGISNSEREERDGGGRDEDRGGGAKRNGAKVMQIKRMRGKRDRRKML